MYSSYIHTRICRLTVEQLSGAVYVAFLGFGCPVQDEWADTGFVTQVVKHLNLPLTWYGTVKSTLHDIINQWNAGQDYVFQRKTLNGGSGGKNKCITVASVDGKKAVNLHEYNNLSVKDITIHLNINQRERGLPEYGDSAVYTFLNRLKKKTSSVGSTKQGNNKSEAWTRARVHIVCQTLARGSVWHNDDPDSMRRFEDMLGTHFEGVCPDWLNLEVLQRDFPVDLKNGVCYFDEKHFRQQIGGFGNRSVRVRYPRNNEGEHDEVFFAIFLYYFLYRFLS